MTLAGMEKKRGQLLNGTAGDKDKDKDTVMDVDEAATLVDQHMTASDDNDKYKPEATFRFQLNNFSEFGQETQRLSPAVYVRGLPWKILAIPRDNSKSDRRTKALGFFLQCNADADSPSWTCSAQAILRVLSQKEGIEHNERKISHTFYPKENDWGYSQFLTFEQLVDPVNGWIKDDTIILEVYVNADAPHGVQWDSKKHTGYIGLKNQGATCYMNSLLQTLYFTNKLRKAVYQIPTEGDDPQTSVALAMQRVFFELQHSDKPVGTKKLTRSFGWDTFESFLQHDVQELCRVLLDNLESKMKGTCVEGTIPKLFEGKMKSYIRCKNVDFESSREEAFYDIQLNIKGKKDIYESFRDYIATETLDGDNKYDAGHFGLQPAEKGVTFMRFPPILHLQLMRFQYDPLQDANVKINDRYEFPEKLCLTEFVADSKESIVYVLHAVLVHSGDFHGGHYVVFINANARANGRWCKFDDDVVSRATVKEAVNANYGGEEPEMPQRAFTNAYMLVYIKQSALADVLSDVSDQDIATHLMERFDEEKHQDAQRKREKQEAHLFTTASIINEELMSSHKGFDLFDPDLAEQMASKFRIEKKASITELYEKIGCSYGLKPVSEFRLWQMTENSGREDGRGLGNSLNCLSRVRPSTLLLPSDPSMCRKDRLGSFLAEDRNLLFIEMAPDAQSLPRYDDNTDMLIFLKYYEPKQGRLSFVGHILINYQGSLRPYFSDMCRRAHLDPKTELLLFEETGPDRVLEISPKYYDKTMNMTDVLSDLSDGAILIFQKAHFSEKEKASFQCYTALQHLDQKYNQVAVEVINQSEPETAPITGSISLTWKISELLEWLGKQVHYDPDKIQLYKTNLYQDKANGPYQHAADVRAMAQVSELLGLGLGGSNKHDPRRERRYPIFFSKMPVRVDELDKRKTIKLQFMDAKMNISEISVYPDKQGTVRTILEEARKQIELANNGSGQLRLVHVSVSPHSSRIHQVLPMEMTVTDCSHKFQTQHYAGRVEEIPLDQMVIDCNEYLLPTCHFDKEPTRTFGTPFFIKVKQGESFADVRERIRKVLDDPKEFDKYKFALVANNRIIRYFDDVNNISTGSYTVNLNELGQTHVTGVTQPWLGIDHMNKLRGRTGHTLEKAIVIHN